MPRNNNKFLSNHGDNSISNPGNSIQTLKLDFLKGINYLSLLSNHLDIIKSIYNEVNAMIAQYAKVDVQLRICLL